jgi:hypothetical protein
MLQEFKLTNADLNKKTDLRVLSLGAGVQSSTLLLLMLEGKVKMADIALFADTGNEPIEVYKYLDYLKILSKDKIKILTVKKSNIIEDALAEKTKGTSNGFITMPIYAVDKNGKKTMGRRQCTNDYKIQPIHKKIREILQVKTLRGKNIEIVMGISFDEQQRAKTPNNKWAINCYPLIENYMTRQDCIDFYNSKEVKKPPRSACIVCPYHSDEEWLDLKKNYPEEFKSAVEFDNLIRDKGSEGYKNYLHSSLIPLSDVVFKEKRNYYQPTLALDECEGMCGI